MTFKSCLGMLSSLFLFSLAPLGGQTYALPPIKPELWPPSSWANEPKSSPTNVELTLSDPPADQAHSRAPEQSQSQAAQLWHEADALGVARFVHPDIPGVFPSAIGMSAVPAERLHDPPRWQDSPSSLPRNITLQDIIEWQAAQERTAVGPWKQVAAIEAWDESGPPLAGAYSTSFRPPLPGSANHNAMVFLDDRHFAIADGRHAIRIFDTATGKLTASFSAPLLDSYDLRTIVHSDDGRLLLVLPSTEPTIWDTRTGQAVATLPQYMDKYISAAFLNHGTVLAVCRGQPLQGRAHGNLQIWDVAEHRLAIRKRIDAPPTARQLCATASYLLLQGETAHVYDAATFTELLTLPDATTERFLYLQTPTASTPGAYVAVELSRGDDWRQQTPQFLAITLPDDNPWVRWNCPIEENRANDDRFDAQYTISPQHEVIAISQEGRVNFFQFLTAKKIGSIPAGNPAARLAVHFLGEHQVLLSDGSSEGHVSIYDILANREIAQIPDSGFSIAVSPDGTCLALRRTCVPDEHGGCYRSLHPPLVILWQRTGE